jgi:hypothetical protein
MVGAYSDLPRHDARMSDLAALEEALAGLEPGRRLHLGAPALVAAVSGELDLDEDDVARATRRGLLLAAAAGDPNQAVAPGSRAVLETAAELVDGPLPGRLSGALERLAASAPGPAIRETAAELAAQRDMAIEALALVLLASQLGGEGQSSS